MSAVGINQPEHPFKYYDYLRYARPTPLPIFAFNTMVLLLHPLHFVDHSSDDALDMTPPPSLWNASKHISQWFLGRDCATTATSQFDMSTSLLPDSFIHSPQSMTPDIDVPCINKLLPPKILEEIFRHYVFDDNPCFLHGSSRIAAHPNARTNALHLCHVCSSWRVLAFSIPSLWSSLCVVWPKRDYFHLVRLWLEKSGSLPLSLFLYQDDLDSDGVVAMREILALCVAHAQRWREVTLDLNGNVHDTFLNLNHNSLGLLESFDVELLDWNPAHVGQLSRALHSSPSLRQAAWGRSFGNALPKNVVWEQLSTVTLSFAEDSEELFSALSRCCGLEVLQVDLLVRAPQPRRSTVSLPNLIDLKMGVAVDMAFFLDGLTLPKLKSMELRHGFGGSPSQGWVSLANLLSRSSCHLQKFKCGGCDFDEDEVIDVLCSHSMASLIELSLSIPVSDKILNALTYKRKLHDFPPLPLLRHLEIDNCDTSDGTLSDLIFSRVAILRSIKANLCGASTYSHDLQMAKGCRTALLLISV